MEACGALVHPGPFLDLLERLEPGATRSQLESPVFQGALLISSKDDPGRTVAYLVATQTPPTATDGATWVKNHPELSEFLREKRVALATVIFPGDWPSRQHRTQVRGGTAVRLISSIHHIWADRLRHHDEAGNVDLSARAALLQKLGGKWDDFEEDQFTSPALTPVDATERARQACRALLSGRPDVLVGGVTVIYGPGGIGKTFFLRRVANKLAKDAIRDPCVGVPIFAELPVLLHSDALETWLSRAGVRLPIGEIRALISTGVITPVLDALDELVRGQAREGSREFLRELRRTTIPRGRAVLSSRDYYLNLDPLVRDELGHSSTAELSVGFFDKLGRRRYIQIRAGLSERDAARWAGQLEEQATQALGETSEAEMVDSLIGHPLFLDAFCAIIEEIDVQKRSSAVDNFRITSPDVFGEIVDRVLEREQRKAENGWQQKFGDLLTGSWRSPFGPQLQREILSALVLAVARDGSLEVTRREAVDPRYRQLRHGLFTFTRGVPGSTADNPLEVLQDILHGHLGPPTVAAHLPGDQVDKISEDALHTLATFYRQHTLADTRPDRPSDLVFATRHRAYFDYILADALLKELLNALSRAPRGGSEEFVDWCLRHHIFEHTGSEGPPFASCLDFVLWHHTGASRAQQALDSLLATGAVSDPILASYACSLGLALVLRYAMRVGSVQIHGKTFANDWNLEIADNIVPVVANVNMDGCGLPNLLLTSVGVRNVVVQDSAVQGLVIENATWFNVSLERCSVSRLELRGKVRMEDCLIDVEDLTVEAVVFDQTGEITLRRCRLGGPVWRAVNEQRSLRPNAIHVIDCEEIEAAEPLEGASRGRRFVDKLMRLLKKDGHERYGVFIYKLRGLTSATGASFPAALRILEERGVIQTKGDMIELCNDAFKYSGKTQLPPRYEDVANRWDPIVGELDQIL